MRASDQKVTINPQAYPLGYNETLAQAQGILANYSTGSYVDLLLIHWPTNYGPCSYHGPEGIPTTDPVCNTNLPTYSPTGCRLSTWKALVDVWKSGGVRAIGVSNFNTSHLEEIRTSGLPMPSVNQVSMARSSARL